MDNRISNAFASNPSFSVVTRLSPRRLTPQIIGQAALRFRLDDARAFHGIACTRIATTCCMASGSRTRDTLSQQCVDFITLRQRFIEIVSRDADVA
jgi:hypothetical protein